MLKKVIKIAVVVLAGAFIVIQFFGIDKANPPVNSDDTLEAAVAVPADISMILARSCNDCHSNKTTYPWYSHVQPFSWFLKDHIDEGRRELNFSVFNTYSNEKKAKKLDEICQEVGSAAMPLPSYLWIHGDAVLSASDATALCDWTVKAGETLSR
ncbi:MAG: heme-binding domain-containing protein [Pyrinomonadaceae bacterium]